MSLERFHEDCPGCRPALAEVNTKTGKLTRMANDHPLMVAVNKVYDASSYEEKLAFHKMSCQNDTSDENMAVLKPLMSRMEEATASWAVDPLVS